MNPFTTKPQVSRFTTKPNIGQWQLLNRMVLKTPAQLRIQHPAAILELTLI